LTITDEDLFPVKAKHAKCWNCPLYLEGQFVPSDGPAKADLAVVGEAPGANEGRVGKPFIGESGQLLNRILGHYEIDRKRIFLSNACLCRDPNGATPSATAIEACRPRLMEELRDHEVKDVVTLGNTAAQAVLATKVGITKLRIGTSRHNEDELPGVRIIPTFHPAACLRVPDFFPSLVNDFGKLKGFHGTWYEPKWKAFEEPHEALAAIAELSRLPDDDEIDVDIESNIEKDVSFEQPARHRLLCVGIGYAEGKVAVIGETACQDEDVLRALAAYLTSRRCSFQNGKFDSKGLWAKLGHVDIKVAFDTMLANYCQDERRGIHALDYQGIEKLGAPDWKHEIEKYQPKKYGYAAIPRPVLYKYNAWDVHVTAMLRKFHKSMLAAQQLTELHTFLCRASDQLKFIELNGIGIDLQYNSELHVSYGASLAILEERIGHAIPDQDKVAAQFGWRGGFFNPRSPKQVKEVVKEVFEMRLPQKMNQKREYAETTDAEALELLADQALGTPAEEFFRRMLEHRKEAKLYGTYVKGIRNRVYGGRVYPTFLLHGTTTGRLSCRNPNLQNIPRESSMRKQFVPTKPENVFLEADYGQNELRVLCWLAQDEYLRAVFNDPTRDLFDELTPVLYGNTAGLDKAALKELRIRVKAYVYGLAYGREARSIALEFGIPVAEAERGMREFFRVIPATVAFREKTRRTVLEGSDLVTAFGRHRRFWLITNSNKKDVLNEALAFLPQSTASDICLDAFCHLRPALRGKAYIRNIVHDSLLVECHRDLVTEVGTMMNRYMLESAKRVVGDYVVFKTDLKMGPSWGELTEEVPLAA
jgi:uracil-DNA glycosylase family 4